ncbi:glycosyltransferase family 4 protein [Microbacter margulisiae]|uniref:UDP-N-acetylmuramyl pentapeptide phosphotransferase/UDP-N-acetylglucosamine-1-phosphate transferase n=1 Tax=Microbacter margulisiae TaxID=1350067 RepID=A0A7W5DRN0_9PORP|nr:MraY family glycosyltransferase [Microbacter margulisiae]MBB3187844.1 UDP-N-acetylmuramyl pentapeptide phosphotransferase/UDP-N-acetylglucosamine-1-phosphate transferase [Microbacter margulisiae]
MIIAFLVSGYLVYISIPVIVHISKAKKLLDYPNYRKVNTEPIPNLGGIALFIGISVSSLISMYSLPLGDIRYMIVAMLIMFFIGIKDDILVLSHRRKFIIQIGSALILIVLGNIRITNLHGIMGIYGIDYISSVVLSLLAIVALVNAINLIDGIDGLAGGLSLLIALFFCFSFWSLGQYQYAILSFAIAGSLVTFLFFNVFGKTNKIFMGDTGSLVLGILFASLMIKYNELAVASDASVKYSSLALSLAAFFVPLFDMTRVFCGRILKGKSPFLPDKSHIHHKFLDLGFSHLKSSLIITVINLLVVVLIYCLRDQDVNTLIAVLLVAGCLLPYFPLIYKIHIINKMIKAN